MPDPISIRDACSKIYADTLFNDPSIIKNTANIDLNDRNITNARFIQVNQWPQIESHLTPRLFVDNAISDGVNEQSLLRLDPDEKLTQDSIILNSTSTSPKKITELPTKNYVDNKFDDPSTIKNTDQIDFNNQILGNVASIDVNRYPLLDSHLTPKMYVDSATNELSLFILDPEEKLNLDNLDSIFLHSFSTLAKTIIELPTKSYVDSLHESSRNRRDLLSVFNDQDTKFDNNKLTNLDSITLNRDPNLDNKLSRKKYVDDSIGEGTIVRFNQTLQNYLKVSVGNDT